MGKLRLGVTLALLCGTTAVRLSAVDRVPRPEFESAYRPPPTSAPPPLWATREGVDLGLLAAALGLATYLAVERRSRRGLVGLGLVSLFYLGFVREGCVCPIGSLQNVALSAADRAVALPLATAGAFVLPLGFALWRGRVFCAGVCPAGVLQDIVLLSPRTLPASLAEALALGRHVYLGLAVLLAVTGSVFLVCSWDPFIALFHLSGSLGTWLLAGLFLGTATLVARPYCRFVCPYGVLLGWCARLASRRARTCPAECVTCRLCEGACPLGALRVPASGRAPETTGRGVRRLGWLLALAPCIVIGSGFAVSRLDVVLARLNPTVQLAERVAAEDAGVVQGSSLESRTYRSGGSQTAELTAAARLIRTRFRSGGWILGGYLGLVTSGALVRLARRQRRTVYGPDGAACLACGRCFAACPQTHKPLLALEEAATHA